MIKTIYANGCSWTAGNGIPEDPALKGLPRVRFNDIGWPKMLAGLMNCQYINAAEGAGSNERIVRTTIDFLMNYPKDKYNELIVVIGWTTLERREVYLDHEGTRGWYRFNATQPFTSHHNHFSRSLRKQIDEHQRTDVALMHTEYADMLAYFQQVYLMKNLLENLEIKYIFFNSLPWVWDFGHPLIPQFATHLQNIDCPQTKGMTTHDSFFQFCKDNNIPMSSCMHPMLAGHSAWAKELRNRIKEVYDE